MPHASFPRPALRNLCRLSPARLSMNTLSLFGLVLAIGLVVDDAIVVELNRELRAEVSFANKKAASFEDVKGNIDTR